MLIVMRQKMHRTWWGKITDEEACVEWLLQHIMKLDPTNKKKTQKTIEPNNGKESDTEFTQKPSMQEKRGDKSIYRSNF